MELPSNLLTSISLAKKNSERTCIVPVNDFLSSEAGKPACTRSLLMLPTYMISPDEIFTNANLAIRYRELELLEL
jgi:hypothetical protein